MKDSCRIMTSYPLSQSIPSTGTTNQNYLKQSKQHLSNTSQQLDTKKNSSKKMATICLLILHWGNFAKCTKSAKMLSSNVAPIFKSREFRPEQWGIYPISHQDF